MIKAPQSFATTWASSAASASTPCQRTTPWPNKSASLEDEAPNRNRWIATNRDLHVAQQAVNGFLDSRVLEKVRVHTRPQPRRISEHEIAKVIPELTLRLGFVFVLTGFLLAVLCVAAYRWIF